MQEIVPYFKLPSHLFDNLEFTDFINTILSSCYHRNKVEQLQSKNSLAFSFWYAVTAINSVSRKTYVRNVLYGRLMMSEARTRWKRGWYFCIEFNIVCRHES